MLNKFIIFCVHVQSVVSNSGTCFTPQKYDMMITWITGRGWEMGDGAGKFVLDEDWDEILGTEWGYGKYSGME